MVLWINKRINKRNKAYICNWLRDAEQEISNLGARIEDEIQEGADKSEENAHNVGNKCPDHTPNTIHQDTYGPIAKVAGLTRKEIFKESNAIHSNDTYAVVKFTNEITNSDKSPASTSKRCWIRRNVAARITEHAG